ncbi:MAG TPA: NAD(P)/FAD-dependent oxidoreductase [Azospira sp.]|nr:NAD(P)/FAD-dependent oxidoreductase [Azospira sp.]
MSLQRRDFLKALGLASAAALAGCASGTPRGAAHVVVVGGGFGGATAAKYLRKWSQGGVRVTLVEQDPSFISCPISNLVLSGDKTVDDLTVSYAGLRDRWGVRVLQDRALALDPVKRTLRLAQGGELAYDRIVLSPGVDFLWDQVPALNNAEAQARFPHAWKAGPQTLQLRQQLQAMKDGGVFAITIPKAPYRCPPGPYERASLVAHYLKRHKPRSKLLVLDANEDIVSKKGLFLKAWSDLYPGLLEYRPNSELRDVDVRTSSAMLEFDQVRADVLNVIPPQRAGAIAAAAGLKLINGRWVEVDWLSLESVNTPGVHVLGDAIFAAPAMPKSGHMANQQAKLAAAAILNLLAGEAPNPAPVLMNTCYSFVDDREAIHVASVHQYDAEKKTVLPVQGAGGLSSARSELEGQLALAWAKNIWADALA